jgi:glycosyltransferase involved in cell wall biosynthesis
MGNSSSVSVVIPTYNRPEDLDRCLQSISEQSVLPSQVIVVDNGSVSPKDIISKWNLRFSHMNIELIYLVNTLENSANVARNIGISHSKGLFVSFLDDDLTLDQEYYHEILTVFQRFPEANGVQGYNVRPSYHSPVTPVEKIWDHYKRFFQISSFYSENGCTLLPSLCVTYPFPGVTQIQTCEWMSGASVYRRSLLAEIHWDNQLKKYSWNDDQDISYRVFKKYPGSLYLNPRAKYSHKGSQSGRNPTIEIIYASEVYDFYLFFKNIDYTLQNLSIFLRSRIARLFANIFFDLIHFSKYGVINSYHRINALFYVMRHLRKIRRGDLVFFNTWLMDHR